MEILWETVAFACKALIVLGAFVIGALVLIGESRAGGEERAEGRLVIKRLNERFEQLAESMRHGMMSDKEWKAHRKEWKKAQKDAAPRDKSVFLLEFKGDVFASQLEQLRHEVTAVLEVAREGDEVVVRLESPGGAAHSYGLAASQLARVRERGIPLTACVDAVAASGGYMMACVANTIVAAPFAILGSIGVAAPVPNLHRLLDRHGIDYENATAGKYKRTVSYFAPITEEGRAKFQAQLDETHDQFKAFVKQYRAALDIDAVATGEYWHGTKAHELGLVDKLTTSDDYLRARATDANIYELRFHRRRGVRERMGLATAEIFEAAYVAVASRWRGPMT
ncbi:MAG: protease SohB [Myxococcales bacterium]|nr:protease SohB [Myxococcales bacterium]